MGEVPSVLVVEDDEGVRESVGAFLALLPCLVTMAPDGLAALDYLKRGELPNLILLDLNMPRMDGLSFRSHQLGDDRFASIPVIVLSAHSGLDRHVELFRGVEWLGKPFRAADLRDAVTRALQI
jgi:CheY-like chemotaxis protein